MAFFFLRRGRWWFRGGEVSEKAEMSRSNERQEEKRFSSNALRLFSLTLLPPNRLTSSHVGRDELRGLLRIGEALFVELWS